MGAPPADPFALPGDPSEREVAEEELCEAFLEELAGATAHCADEVGAGVMERPRSGTDADEAESPDLAQRIACGWPCRDDEPTGARDPRPSHSSPSGRRHRGVMFSDLTRLAWDSISE